jgi:tripartite ATP-independent transporter DctP family solute receptor
MYPSMQLGGEKEMIEQAQVGALQIARISVGAMGPVVDDLNVFNLPFIFRDEAHMRKVIDGPIGAELLEKINTNPASRIVALGWMDAGVRNVYGKKPVPTPADLKGQKIRMMGNPIFVETMNAMGGSGVAMGFNELYSALETGVVDGAENNPPTLLAQNHYLVSKVYTLTGHLIIPEIFIFSKRTWDGLTPEDQALLKKLSREAQFEQRKLWDEKTVTAEAELKAKGVTFVPADKAAYYKATQPIRDKYGASTPPCSSASKRRSSAMRAAYALAMERLYLACIVVSAVALVAITLVIPYGVFMRYVMNSASSWPEPFSVLAMVLFSFVGGAAAYRAGAHICVQMLTDAGPAGGARRDAQARRPG